MQPPFLASVGASIVLALTATECDRGWPSELAGQQGGQREATRPRDSWDAAGGTEGRHTTDK